MLFIPQKKAKQTLKRIHDEWEVEMKQRSEKRREEYLKQIKNEKQQGF